MEEGGNIIRNVFGMSHKEAESITIDASEGDLNFISPKGVNFYGKDGGTKFGKYVVKKEEERIVYVSGHFYNEDGTFEGKVNEVENEGSVEDVYVCDGKSIFKNEKGEESITYNDIQILKENDINIKHGEFINNAYLVFHEASIAGNKETALWIAHTVNNALNSKYRKGKNTFNQLFKTGYSSVKESDKVKIIPTTSNNEAHCFARSAMISVLKGNEDPTSKSYFWDGLDLFTRSGDLDHPKFKQYRSVNITKAHLNLAIDFWNVDSNKAKVNKNAKINSIFSKEEYPLKNTADGVILNEGVFFLEREQLHKIIKRYTRV